MLIYCAKQKKQTACVPGSETFVVTKNGRNGMKCQCAECGATKFRSLKGKNGAGLGDILGSFTKGLLFYHVADRKMVKSLDAVPWNERQWGHWLARNAINTKRKVGLGGKKVKKKRPKINLG